jgi:hypothetical protein
LQYKLTYQYEKSSVIIFRTDHFDNLERKTTYYLNSSSLADSSIDSSYYKSKLHDVVLFKYSYDNENYIKSTDIYYTFPSYSHVVYLEYKIEKGNITSIDISGENKIYYTYTNIKNKIDIASFIGDFNGKKNSNLILL